MLQVKFTNKLATLSFLFLMPAPFASLYHVTCAEVEGASPVFFNFTSLGPD